MRLLLLLLLVATLAPAALTQPSGAERVTDALVHPRGVTTDTQGRIWVAETGTDPESNDGQVSIVLPDGQVFPFLTDLPSGGTPEEQRGINHLLLDGDDLWFTLTISGAEGYLYRISTAGFTPGDPPHTLADVALTVDVAGFVFSEGFVDSNAYALAFGPDGALYLTDAGANAVLRYDPAADALSVLATFDDLANPTPIGPPMVQAVPTGLLPADGRLYVASLTGFPFVEGLARVYAVEMDGAVSVFRDGLTALTDVAADPRDGALTVLRHGVFGFDPPPPGFRPETGRVLRLDDDRELASGFSLAAGMAYDADGTLYVTTLGGALYRVASSPVATEPAVPTAGGFALHAAYPNPASSAVTLAFELGTRAQVRLAVYDVLGREVAVLADGERPAGRYTVPLDVRRLSTGVYLARLEADGQAQTRRMALVR